VTPRELRKVESAAQRVAKARAELADAMLAAQTAGQPLRPIAQAAGLSVETTRQRIFAAAEPELEATA